MGTARTSWPRTSTSASVPAALTPLSRRSRGSASQGSTAAPLPPARTDGLSTMSVADSASKRPTIWLPAVLDSPSVATSAPTPITVPSTVSATRAGRASRPASASVAMSWAHMRGRPAAEPRRRGRGSERRGRFTLNSSVSRPSTIRTRRSACCGDVLLVRDHDERQAVRAELVEQREHRVGVGRVEVAGRLVAQQQAVVGHQRAGDGHALLLATGQLGGPEAGAVLHAHALERRHRALGAALARRAAVDLGQHHVVEHGAVGQQVEGLEDEPDGLRAQHGALVVVELAHVDAVDEVGARRLAVEAAEDVQQGRLARARHPDDGQRLAVPDGQVDVAQRVDRRVRAELTRDSAQLDGGLPLDHHELGDRLRRRAHGPVRAPPAPRARDPPREPTTTRSPADSRRPSAGRTSARPSAARPGTTGTSSIR